jgi:hypothetical protein
LLAAVGAECERAGLSHQIVPASGSVAASLREFSRVADLVVVCHPALQRALKLREALTLARRAACPLLFAAADPLPWRRVAACYDGTPAGARLLRFAAGLCAGLNLRLAVTVAARQRWQVERLEMEARLIAVAYHLEHEVAGYVGLRGADFAAAAAESGAQVLALPPLPSFLQPALQLTSLATLTGS